MLQHRRFSPWLGLLALMLPEQAFSKENLLDAQSNVILHPGLEATPSPGEPIDKARRGNGEHVMGQSNPSYLMQVKTSIRSAKRWLKAQSIPIAQALLPKRLDLDPNLWSMHIGANGHLWSNNHDLPQLLRQMGSPLHVVDKAKLLANIQAFQPELPSQDYAPGQVYVSYKTQPVAGVLAITHEHGMGAECISAYEYWLARQLGVQPEHIIYNGPVKSTASVEQAIAENIKIINCNHKEEVAQIEAIAKALHRKARIGIRIVPAFGWSGQFGASVQHGDAMAAIQQALNSPHLELVGLHAHHGSALRSAQQVESFIQDVLAFVDEVFAQTQHTFDMLDIGGSLATPTVRHLDNLERQLNTSLLADLIPPDAQATLPIPDYVRLVRQLVAKHFQQRQQKVPTVIFEPGRALFGNTQTLLTSVVTIKQEQQGPDWLILDGGINLAECVRYEYHQLYAATRMQAQAEQYYRIAGPICTPGDVLYGSWKLPTMAPGDVLAIMDAGAYFVPFATSFSYPQPAIVLLDGPSIQLLRRAETFQDMASFDTIFSKIPRQHFSSLPQAEP